MQRSLQVFFAASERGSHVTVDASASQGDLELLYILVCMLERACLHAGKSKCKPETLTSTHSMPKTVIVKRNASVITWLLI